MTAAELTVELKGLDERTDNLQRQVDRQDKTLDELGKTIDQLNTSVAKLQTEARRPHRPRREMGRPAVDHYRLLHRGIDLPRCEHGSLARPEVTTMHLLGFQNAMAAPERWQSRQSLQFQ